MSYYYRSPWMNLLVGVGGQVAKNLMDLVGDAARGWLDIPTDTQRAQQQAARIKTLLKVAELGGEPYQHVAPQLEKSLGVSLPREQVTDLEAPTELAKTHPAFGRTQLAPGVPGGLSFPEKSVTGEPFFGKKEQYTRILYPTVEEQLAKMAAEGAIDPRHAKAQAPKSEWDIAKIWWDILNRQSQIESRNVKTPVDVRRTESQIVLNEARVKDIASKVADRDRHYSIAVQRLGLDKDKAEAQKKRWEDLTKDAIGRLDLARERLNQLAATSEKDLALKQDRLNLEKRKQADLQTQRDFDNAIKTMSLYGVQHPKAQAAVGQTLARLEELKHLYGADKKGLQETIDLLKGFVTGPAKSVAPKGGAVQPPKLPPGWKIQEALPDGSFRVVNENGETAVWRPKRKARAEE